MGYGLIAHFYDILDWPCEVARYRHIRPQLVGDLRGRILDAGVGTGRNLPYFSSGVNVTGIDLSESMLVKARARAVDSGCAADLRRMDVTSLEFPDDSFDAVVSTFLFCVLPDELQLKAVKELERVTRRGGVIRIVEYQYSVRPWQRRWMKVMAPVVELVYGARFDRRTSAAIREAGFTSVSEKFVHSDTIKLIELVV